MTIKRSDAYIKRIWATLRLNKYLSAIDHLPFGGSNGGDEEIGTEM
jgi:hypothetical protein